MNHISEKLKEVTLTIQNLQDCYDKVRNPAKKEEIYNIIYQLQQLKSSVEINKNYLPGVNVAPVSDINVKPVKVPSQPSLQLPLGTMTIGKAEQKNTYLPENNFSNSVTPQALQMKAQTTADTIWQQRYKDQAEGFSFNDKNQVANWVHNNINVDSYVPNDEKALVIQILTQNIIAMKHLKN